MIKVCEYKACGKEFWARHNSNRFCSHEHGCLARRKPRLEGDCEYCGKHFITTYTIDKWHYKSGHQKLRYCKREHALSAQRKEKIKGVCKLPGCNNEIEVYPSDIKYGHGRGSFCSIKHRAEYYTGERHIRWTNNVSEGERLRKSKEYIAWRTAVFIRDEKTCTSCGKVYNRAKHLNASIEGDHIYPRYLFPELIFDIRNGRTLCKDCHRDTPTYFNNKYKREDFLPDGKLYDYALTSLQSIGIIEQLVKE